MGTGYKLLECIGCGFQFVSPRPTIHELQSVYDPPPEGTFAAKSSEEARRVAVRIDRILSRYAGERHVLEVGCNTGFILHGLSRLGYSVTGTDLSSTALAYARREYGLTDVYCSEFPPDDRVETLDIVLASHIIEHVIDPQHFVEQCARFLKPNGVFLVFTPNVRSAGMRMFGRHYPVFCPPIHINYFSKQTLRRLV